MKNGSLSPSFDRQTTEYTLECSMPSVILTAIASSTQSTIYLNGKQITSKQDILLDFVHGETLTIEVASPDNTLRKRYILTMK